MKPLKFVFTLSAVLAISPIIPLSAAQVCTGFGPQTPRDITSKAGTNKMTFGLARSIENMNLCNIHFHKNAEHKGPGFSEFAGKSIFGGYRCNGTPNLTKAELAPAKGACKGIKPGDTIEVHWVHSSCNVKPGPTLGACLSDKCANPQLRVETKVFLVVNDKSALDFDQFAYKGNMRNGYHKAKSLPVDKDPAVLFQGSTTGPKYTEKKCSPLQVTWNVQPNCAKVDISSLNKWCESNVFKEDKAQGVRQLVTSPELLSEIK